MNVTASGKKSTGPVRYTRKVWLHAPSWCTHILQQMLVFEWYGTPKALMKVGC